MLGIQLLHWWLIRVAEVRFSSVLPPLRENLELDLNLRGHLVQNREPELQNRFHKVRSAVQAGSDLKKKTSSHKRASAAVDTFGRALGHSIITELEGQAGYISHYQLAQIVSSRVLQPLL